MAPIDAVLAPFQAALVRPAIVAVDEDEGSLRDLERELRERYAPHYRVMCTTASHEARTCLKQLAGAGDEVALVLVAEWLSGMTGRELLDKARRLHPRARRGLLIERGGLGAGATGEAIFGSLGHGRIDHSLFHQAISGLLLDWADERHGSRSPELLEGLPPACSPVRRHRAGSPALIGPRKPTASTSPCAPGCVSQAMRTMTVCIVGPADTCRVHRAALPRWHRKCRGVLKILHRPPACG
jgi:hypothetical protein